MRDRGICLDENYHCLVTYSKFLDLHFDSYNQTFWKDYDPDVDGVVLPFSVLMKKRSENHYANLNPRINNLVHCLKPKKQVVCLNQNLYGIIGTIDMIDLAK